MHVTCRFFRDTLNAVTAALTWSFIEGDSREYLRNFRRLFMYSVSLEYMNNYVGGMEWEQRREKEKERKRWEVSTILLIRSIYRRSTIYLRHVAARLRSSRSYFHSRLLATILVSKETIRTCVSPFVSSTHDIIRDETPMSCATCFFPFIFFVVFFISSLRTNFFPIQNVNRTLNLSKADVLIMKNC